MKCKVCKTEAELAEFTTFEVWTCKVCNKELCPDCGAHVRAKSLQEGGSFVCSDKCGWWFCF